MKNMSQVYAKLSDSQTSPKKIRIVIDLIKNKDVALAERILQFHPSKGARILAKVLNSVISNAMNNLKLSKENLIISEVFANEATPLKRGRAASKGRNSQILKRRTHVTIGLSERSK
jgi:large subunit ribosomal protein L22